MANDGDNENKGSACGGDGGGHCRGHGKWVWILLVAAIAGVLIAKHAATKPGSMSAPTAKAAAPIVQAPFTNVPQAAVAKSHPLPRLVDLGARKCMACKMMAPILDDLKTTYTGKLDVAFIDVWENPEAAEAYSVGLIPTQIFYDEEGKELSRHEGFLAREDILATWKELGVELPIIEEKPK